VNKKIIFCWDLERYLRKEWDSDPEPEPDPLSSGTDQRGPDPYQNITDQEHWFLRYIGPEQANLPGDNPDTDEGSKEGAGLVGLFLWEGV
jgi:hypothetical protein